MHFETIEFKQPASTNDLSARLTLRRSSATSIQSNKIRVLVIGDSGVGKSSLIKRFTEKRFGEDFDIEDSTQYDEGTMVVELMEINVNLVITLKSLAIKAGQAYILMYSPDKPGSVGYISNIKQEIDILKGSGMPIISVRNKADILGTNILKTPSSEPSLGIPHTEISLQTGKNIGEVYRNLFNHPTLQRLVDIVSVLHTSLVTANRRRMSLPAFDVQRRIPVGDMDGPAEVVPKATSESRVGIIPKSLMKRF